MPLKSSTHEGQGLSPTSLPCDSSTSSTPVKGEPVHERKDAPTTPPLQPSRFISFPYFPSCDGQAIFLKDTDWPLVDLKF